MFFDIKDTFAKEKFAYFLLIKKNIYVKMLYEY